MLATIDLVLGVFEYFKHSLYVLMLLMLIKLYAKYNSKCISKGF